MRKVLALLVAAAAVVPAVAVDPQAAGGSALIQEGDRAEEKLWFHLDDLLQQQEDAGAGQAQAQAPSPADFSSGGSELSESGAPAAAQGGVEKEATAARKDKTGGSTTVLSNRNFMSIMEDAEGRQLNPQLAAAEGRLEAHEAARKAAADAQRKRSSEQNGKALAAKKAKEDNERALNELAKVQGSAVEEVRKAQAKSDEINRQTLELRQKAEAELAAKKAAEWQFGSDGADFGGDYLGVVATKLGDACALEGLMRKGSTQPVLGYLPVQCRPSKRLMIAPKMGPRDTSVDKAGEAFHRAVARVDLLADGRVYLVASQHAVDWMSFAGVRFFVKDPPLPVEFMPEWSSFGGDFRSVGVSAESFQGSDGKLCTLSGLLRGNKWGYFLTLPAECRPKRRLAFSTCNGVAVTRVDVETNGKVLRAGGSAHGNWVSLDGVAFPTADAKAQNLDLADGWRHYDNDLWGPAQFHRLGNTCILTGLVTRTGTTSLLGRLPAGCRPKARLIFSGNTNDYSARVDVTPAGEIYAVGLSAAWVSLSSVSFTVTD